MTAALTPEFVDFIPEVLEDGKLYISQTYATAVHKCCCGCGHKVVTPLSPTGWRLAVERGFVSLYPSIGIPVEPEATAGPAGVGDRQARTSFWQKFKKWLFGSHPRVRMVLDRPPTRIGFIDRNHSPRLTQVSLARLLRRAVAPAPFNDPAEVSRPSRPGP
jgi:hypothetical protein